MRLRAARSGKVKGWRWLKSWRLDELAPNPGHEAVPRSKGAIESHSQEFHHRILKRGLGFRA